MARKKPDETLLTEQSVEMNIVTPEPAVSTKAKPTDIVFQFKSTLLCTKPLIWRRIQVKDCTLDKLHEHIQTSMGWTNSHLHHFRIDGTHYGDPMLVDEL